MNVQLIDRHYRLLGWGVVSLGFVATFVYGWLVQPDHSLRTAIGAAMIGAAPFALGGIAGFLFGIPKTLQQPEPPKDGPQGAAARHGWQANTNLEQVSDWLTKIMIGVGLTELGRLPDTLQDISVYIASSLGPAASPMVVSAMLITFSIVGFVVASLLTKFDLGRAIDDQDGLLEKLEKAIVKNPNNREAVESLMLSSLYMDSPDGFERTIQAGEAFLSQEGHPQSEDGNVFAYLACAYGQKYAREQQRQPGSTQLKTIRDSVIANARRAIERAPQWRGKLRQFANPPVGSKENDLATLKDDPELRQILDMT